MLHPRWGDPWSVYADGYREAADIIVARINEGHRQQDALVYPVMFLCRQYLELAIKNLIRKSWKRSLSATRPMIWDCMTSRNTGVCVARFLRRFHRWLASTILAGEAG